MQIREYAGRDFFELAELPALLAEYAHESAMAGLPVPNPHQGLYLHIEASGALSFLAAMEGETLVGFLGLIVTTNPHYSVKLAVVESFFVAAAHRKSGAGLRLLRHAEQLARSKEAVGFLVSAPTGGKLAQVMERNSGYRETNRVFFRSLQ